MFLFIVLFIINMNVLFTLFILYVVLFFLFDVFVACAIACCSYGLRSAAALSRRDQVPTRRSRRDGARSNVDVDNPVDDAHFDGQHAPHR